MRARVIVSSTVATLLILAGLARAQGAPAEAMPQVNVAPGEKIVLTTIDGDRVEGRLRSITPDVLSLQLRHGLGIIELRRVDRIVVKDSVRNGLLIGLSIGAGAGITAGAVANAFCVNDTGSCLGFAAMVAAAGAAGGAAIGAGLDGLRHRVAFERGPDALRGAGLAVGLWHAAPRSSTPDMPPQVTARFSVARSASDTRIHRSGVSVRGAVGLAW